MIIKNIKYQLFIRISMIVSLSLLFSSSAFASNKKHVIRLVPGQEISFASYNIICTKNNSYIKNNATYANNKNLSFKGKVELDSNNIKLGSKALVKIDNFKVKCLASNVFEKSNTVFIDDDDDDDDIEIKTTTSNSKNSIIIESLLDDEEIHPRCTDDSKDDFSIFEEYDSSSYGKKSSSSTTNKESSINIKINLDSLFE